MHIFHGIGHAVGMEGRAYADLHSPAFHRRFGIGICRNVDSCIRCFLYFGQCLSFGNGVLVAKVYGITAFLITVVLLVIAFALMIVLAKKSGFYNKVVLRDKQEAQDFDESTLQGLLGAEGVTQTTLRSYGIADFQGKMVDVCSNGDFIDRGKRVRVTHIQGKTVTVAEC